MPNGRVAYITRNFRDDTRHTIAQANLVCEEYARQGLRLTLRQVYYQFVSRGWIHNDQKNYDKLGSVLNDARLAGALSWDYIEDRTRFLRAISTWASPSHILSAVANQYKRDLWATQPVYVETWIEKDALVGVIEGVCEDNRVPYMSCRGYFSASEMREAGLRYSEKLNQGKQVVVLHFGDHDPSGMDMSRDIQDRLDLYTQYHAGTTIELRRIALNMGQINLYNPPPNPVKLTDSRSPAYTEAFGTESWELDALTPGVINALIQTEIDGLREQTAWDRATKQEETERDTLTEISDHFDDVEAFLREREGVMAWLEDHE